MNTGLKDMTAAPPRQDGPLPLPLAPPVSAGILWGLAIFALVMVAALIGVGWLTLQPHEPRIALSLLLFGLHFILPPVLAMLGASLLNRLGKSGRSRIHPRNALAFGWLMAIVVMLWRMGVHS